MEDIVSRTILSASAARIEVDQRAREARLRLEHAEGLLILSVPMRRSWLRRAIIGPPAEEAVSADARHAEVEAETAPAPIT
jgi:hypothetical protein